MRIALLQTAGDPQNRPAANLGRLEEAAARAAVGGARLLVAPEMFLSGYNIGAQAAAAAAGSVDGRAPPALAGIARRHGIAICYGYPERGEGGAVYNSALLIDRDGDHAPELPQDTSVRRPRPGDVRARSRHG